MENKDHVPPLENWLQAIRDVYRLHRDELDAIDDADARYRRLVELNVVEQVLNLYKTGVVQRRRVKTHQDEGSAYPTPRIHACGTLLVFAKFPIDIVKFIGARVLLLTDCLDAMRSFSQRVLNLASSGKTIPSATIFVSLPRRAVFDPKTGYLKRLEVDFKSYTDELHQIYDLYTP